MLPSHIAENIKKQVLFYLQSTFFFRDRDVEKGVQLVSAGPANRNFQGAMDSDASAFSSSAQRGCVPL